MIRWTQLDRLGRNALLGLLAALLIAEGGLVYLGWLAVERPAASVPAAGTHPAAVPSAPPPTAAAAGQGPAEAAATWRPPESWAAPAQSAQAAAGDLLGISRYFDVEEAMAHVEALAGPAFGGRQPGTPEHAAAGQYIADRYAEYGLLPAGSEGFFQPFTVPYARVTATPTLRITAPSGQMRSDFLFRQDYAYAWGGYAGGGQAAGPVTWAGDCLAEDLRGLDVSGGILFCRGRHYEEAGRQAVEHGASGLLLLAEVDTQITRLRTYRAPAYLPASLPTLWVGDTVAAWLLRGTGYRPSDLSILYEPVPLESHAAFTVEMDEPGEAEARNILGILPGADPERADELLILGAHYDHLGTDANGDVYAGANDDASGVAALLEVARSWQEAGYVPAVPVLFASWDSEEQGLLGAAHYAAHPLMPLTQTVGMIQLDMVGLASEGVLLVDGDLNPVGAQLMASAGLFGVPAEGSGSDGGSGSDHAVFARAGVDAALLIWDNAEVPYYHTPADTPETLQPERLQLAGAITSHAAQALSSAAGNVRTLLAAQTEAIAAGDAAAYVATLDPADLALREAGRAWLLPRAAAAGTYTATVGSVLIEDTSATAEVTAHRTDAEGQSVLLATYPVRLVRRDGAWYTAGPAYETAETPLFTARFASPWRAPRIEHDELATGSAAPTVPSNTDADWVAALDEVATRVYAGLGYTPTMSTTVTVYPNDRARRWLAPGGTWAEGAALPAVEVSRTAPLTETAVSLALEGLGLPTGQGAWLRTGLLDLLAEGQALPEGEGALAQAGVGLPQGASAATVLAATGTLGVEDRRVARSLAAYLVAQEGVEGLTALLRDWGAAGSLDGALAASAHPWPSSAELDAAWRYTVADPWLAAAAGIAETLERRSAALAAGDGAAFLATVSAADPLYTAEQRAWFVASAPHLSAFQEQAEVIILRGDEALARLSAAGAPGQSQTVRFTRQGDAWLLAGPDWRAEPAGALLIRHAGLPPEALASLRSAVERAERLVTGDLGLPLPRPLDVRVYESTTLFQYALGVGSATTEPGHYAPGQPILISADLAPAQTAPWLARLLARAALSAAGLPDGALKEGLALLEAARVAPEEAWTLESTYLPAVRDELRYGRVVAWEREPAPAGAEPPAATVGQAWMLWDGIAHDLGMGTVRAMARRLAQGQPLEDAFAAASGRSFADWEPTRHERLAAANVSAEELATAKGFDPSQTLATVRMLCSADYSGRQTGSPGAEAASRWIADEMAAAGLQPGAPDGTFFRTQPVSYTALVDVPVLSFRNDASGQELALAYPDGFRVWIGQAAGRGEAEAGLVWLPGGYDERMDLGGRVVLKRLDGEPLEEAAQASLQGAGGLVLVSPRVDTLTRALPVTGDASHTLPVVQISEETWRAVLSLAGLTPHQALTAPAALLLPVTAQIAVPYAPAEPAEARDVVGLLPGTRPGAAPLVVMAHYDGVGSLPGGTNYPGANKDAAGVAVLLEAARQLTSSGLSLEHPIYFIATGAEEWDMASTRAYLAEPWAPLTETLGVLVLDQVGQARSYYLTWDGDKSREGRLLYTLALAAELVDRRGSPGKYRGVNSHQMFQQAGVPTALLFWPDADDVHQPEDTPDTLDLAKLAVTGEVLTLTLLMLGG